MKKHNRKIKSEISLSSSNYHLNNTNNNIHKKLNNLTTINLYKEKKIQIHKRSKSSSYKSQSSRPTLLSFFNNNNNSSIKNRMITKPNYYTTSNFFKQNHSLSPNSTILKTNYILPPKTTEKKTLVLDLDETLVHSGFIPFNIPSDLIIQIELENEMHDIHILIRPYVKEFLEKMSKRFEIVIFTASISKYANPLLDLIDKNKYCNFRLFREHCTLINTAFVKDLNRLGRNLKDIIIVDNTPSAYALNQYNGFPIKSWFDDKNDFELIKIIPILEFLSYVNDVRVYIKKIVSQNQIKFDFVSKVISDYHKSLKNSSMIIFNKKKKFKTILSKSRSTRDNILKKINADNYNNVESIFGKLKFKKKQLSITNSNFLKKNNNFYTMNTMRNNSSKKNIILITLDKKYISTDNISKQSNNNKNEKNNLLKEINNKKIKPNLNMNYLKSFLTKIKNSKGKNIQMNKENKNS